MVILGTPPNPTTYPPLQVINLAIQKINSTAHKNFLIFIFWVVNAKKITPKEMDENKTFLVSKTGSNPTLHPQASE